MEDLGTLGGPTSQAFGISETGVVVGISSTAAGTEEAFLWTRGGGMRSLGTPDGNTSAGANAVNTHRRVVGTTEDFFHPFLWTPGDGMRPLSTLGGGQGQPNDINEFGQIAGTSVTAGGALRAVLWTPTAGPLAVAPTDAGGSDLTR
jgi:probable HAF family extracellular repeat protein